MSLPSGRLEAAFPSSPTTRALVPLTVHLAAASVAMPPGGAGRSGHSTGWLRAPPLRPCVLPWLHVQAGQLRDVPGTGPENSRVLPFSWRGGRDPTVQSRLRGAHFLPHPNYCLTGAGTHLPAPLLCGMGSSEHLPQGVACVSHLEQCRERSIDASKYS